MIGWLFCERGTHFDCLICFQRSVQLVVVAVVLAAESHRPQSPAGGEHPSHASGCPLAPPCRCQHSHTVFQTTTSYTLNCKNKGLSSKNPPSKSSSWEGTDVFFSLVDLSQNKLSVLENGVLDQITNVSTFDISSNIFTRIPTAVQNVKFAPHLDKLTLSNNRIRLTGSPFARFGQVTVLLLNNNSIRRLSADIFSGLGNLTHLDFSENRITTLPQEVFRPLRKLSVLQSNGNKLRRLEPFSNLPQLQYLDLSENRIAFLGNGTFSNLPALVRVNLANNKLKTFNPGAFGNTPTLTFLSLASNDIKTFGSNAFESLPNLTLLDLNRNRLTRLPNVSQLTKLQVLSAARMRISRLYPCNFENLTNLRHLYLSGNPLKCDCQLKWLKVWYDTHVTETTDQETTTRRRERWTCSGGGRKKRRSFHTLTEDDFGCPDTHNYTDYCYTSLNPMTQTEELLESNDSTCDTPDHRGQRPKQRDPATTKEPPTQRAPLHTESSEVADASRTHTAVVGHFHMSLVVYVVLGTLSVVILIIAVAMVVVCLLKKKFKSSTDGRSREAPAPSVPSISENIFADSCQGLNDEPPPYVEHFDATNPYACWGTPYDTTQEHTYQELTPGNTANREYMGLSPLPSSETNVYATLNLPSVSESGENNRGESGSELESNNIFLRL